MFQVLRTLYNLQGWMHKEVDHVFTVFLWNGEWMSLKEPANKIMMFHTLLKVQDLTYFEHHLNRSLNA